MFWKTAKHRYDVLYVQLKTAFRGCDVVLTFSTHVSFVLFSQSGHRYRRGAARDGLLSRLPRHALSAAHFRIALPQHDPPINKLRLKTFRTILAIRWDQRNGRGVFCVGCTRCEIVWLHWTTMLFSLTEQFDCKCFIPNGGEIGLAVDVALKKMQSNNQARRKHPLTQVHNLSYPPLQLFWIVSFRVVIPPHWFAYSKNMCHCWVLSTFVVRNIISIARLYGACSSTVAAILGLNRFTYYVFNFASCK